METPEAFRTLATTVTGRIPRAAGCALLLALAVTLPGTAAATSFELSATGQGWYQHTGAPNGGSPHNNYIVGDCAGPLGRCFDQRSTRNWFRFDLSSIEEAVVGATLLLDVPLATDGPGFGSSSSPSETYVLFDVSASSLPLLGTTLTRVAVWTDLGSGTSYGTHVATAADVGTTIAIPLDAVGVAALQSSLGGVFVLGGAITTLNDIPDDEYLFGFGGGAPARLLVVVPEPATALLLALGLGLGRLRVRCRASGATALK